MKTFTNVKGLLSFLALTLMAITQLSAQTVTLSPSTTQNISTGGSVNFTATRSSNSSTWPGGNSNFTFTWSSSPAGVTFTNNPGSGGSTSSTVATFPSAGSYQITCFVQEGGGGLNATSAATTVNVTTPAPANLWATSSNGTQISGYTVSNGTLISGPNNIFAPTYPGATNTYTRTAALGRNASPTPSNGHFYWLGTSSGFNNNNGLVEVFAATATGANPTKIGQLDLNGGNNSSLGFVRLGMGADGTGWILAGDGTTVYLARFTSNGVNPVTITMEDNSVTLNGGAAATFTNGDICVSGNNNIYALANDGNGVTQIFIGAPNGNATTFTKKWDLVTPANAPFTGSVNGVAFDLLGSIYLSTSTGLYFVNQSTVNGPAGTVQCSLVQAITGLQDLASNFWPQQSTLPTTLLSFAGSFKNNITTINWEVENEINFSHYEVERKTASGIDYSTIATKTALGNTGRSTYQYQDNLSQITDDVVYYRLKMVDMDGGYKYSNVIMVRKDKKKISGINLYPNPTATGSAATVRFEATANSFVTLRVIDMAGRQLLQQQNKVSEGANSVALNNLNQLQPGIYIIQLSNGEELSVIKFSVVR